MAGPGPLRRRDRVRLLAEIFRVYAGVRYRLLRRRPLPQILDELRSSAVSRSPVTLEPVRLGTIVQRVLGPLPFDTRCLSQSLVLLTLLARRGFASVLVLGADPSGTFGAHAWIERDGEPLLPAWSPDTRLATL